uniref:Uncharacterized protein n=1 Tax=viral metagenome TaxID=1070528 RepID=A0A6C0B247_9ZZZZ
MTTTNTTFNPMQFIDDNFDYINLLMLVGLYIACFVYLLQDTVKTIKMGFANMIGIFIAQFFFLVFVVYILPIGTQYRWFWNSIVIALILEFISSFLLLLKYKNLQDADVDDVILKAKIAGTEYQLSGPYKQNDLYTNILISCDVIIGICVMVFKKFGSDPGNLEPILNVGAWLIGALILSLSSVMVYFAAKAEPSGKPISQPSPAINSKTIPALIFILILNILFVLFISTLISKFEIVNSNLILKLSWGSVFISSLFQIISIFMVIIPYKYLNDKYISKHIELSYSNLLNQELKDYNNLFVAVTTIMIVYVGALIYTNNDLKKQTSMFFEPAYYSGFFYVGGIAMLSMSSEMIKISNDFLMFKNNAPKNINDNNLETVSVNNKSLAATLSS